MGLSAKQPISECGEGVAKEESTSAILLQAMISRARPLWHQDGNPASYKIATTLFVRLLGVVYLIAFISLWVQIDGLIGSHGIIPAGEYLSAVEKICAEAHPPESAFWRVPTLAWISSSDFFLNALCVAGAVFSLLLVFGLLPLPMLILLWACYLSLYQVGQVFLSFQWDIMLLEVGFIAIFLVPALRSRCFSDRGASRLALWLLWWLLFRLMFESGVVKLTWNDGPGLSVANAWESLTALDFHYWTQPLPLGTSWYTSQLPAWFQKCSVVGVFVIQLVIPFFIFGSPLFRRIASGAFIFLMLLIIATGNYNFFNVLTICLSLTLLDDAVWPKRMKNRLVPAVTSAAISWRSWKTYLSVPLFAYAIFLGCLQINSALFPTARWSRLLISKVDSDRFHLVNSYGLFRRMTETRPEIIIEGSNDGKHWKAYEFFWKPGDLARSPKINVPHQPRLDWQMWFEALRFEQIFDATKTVEPRYTSPWFRAFVTRLMQQQTEVLKLLKKNPFPDHPPKFFRLALYQYRFTNRQEWYATGNWWHRDLQWLSPAFSPAQ